jgi:hypothetical protein
MNIYLDIDGALSRHFRMNLRDPDMVKKALRRLKQFK